MTQDNDELREALQHLASSPDRDASLSVGLDGVTLTAKAGPISHLQGVPPTEDSGPASREAVVQTIASLIEAGMHFKLSMPDSSHSQLVLSLPSTDGAPSMTMDDLIKILRDTQGIATIHPDGQIDIIIG